MNNQQPYNFFPGNQGFPFSNHPNQQCNCTNQIRSINNQINNLERQINQLERRLRRIEYSNNSPMPYGINETSSDFNGSYDTDNYII